MVVSWRQSRSASEAARFKRAQWVWDDVLYLLRVSLEDVIPWTNKYGNPIPKDPQAGFTLPWLRDETALSEKSSESGNLSNKSFSHDHLNSTSSVAGRSSYESKLSDAV